MSLFRKPYYFVPPCPVCGSRSTGRIQAHTLDETYVEVESLKNGEIVRFREGTVFDPKRAASLPDAFCVLCGHEWRAGVKAVWMTAEQIEAEKKARGTKGAYKMLSEALGNDRPKKKSLLSVFLSR